MSRRAAALRDVSFGIGPGERVVIAGPSGAGKSTLALSLAGLIPTHVEADMRGQVKVAGRPTVQYPPGALAERVGVVFQDPGSQVTMLTVEDEVAFGLENLGVPRSEMGPLVHSALQAVGLADRTSWRIDRLSGGQQQRVVLAAVLAMHPDVLILDEPSAHLDPASAEALYENVRANTDRRGGTLVLVEHDLDAVVPDLVDRALVIDREGSLVFDGPVREAFSERCCIEHWMKLGIWLPSPVRLAHALDEGLERFPLSAEEGANLIAARPALQARLRDAEVRSSASSPGEDVLRAEGVSQRYVSPASTHRALDGVSLTVRAGEMVALVGRSGSGKSTLLRALAGLLPLERGRVTAAGVDLTRANARQIARLVGLVFQDPEAGFVADTVADEVAYGPRSLGWNDAEVERHVAASLERFGLLPLARANPYTLSQGQKRRLSVASSLVLGPRALLLDEPTFGQDARSAQALMQEIDTLRAQGMAVVIATHDLALAAEWTDRVMVLDGGRIAFEGAPRLLMQDESVLAGAGHRATPLVRMLRLATQRGADVPSFLRWRDLPGWP